MSLLLLGIVGISSLGGGDKQETATDTTDTSALAQTDDETATAPPGDEIAPPDDVVTGLNQALSAWGQFAVSGDLETVRPYFVNDGEEFKHFEAEAPTIAGDAAGGDPLTMNMTNAKTVKTSDNAWTFQGTVVVSRTGTKDQQFQWEIALARQSADQPWQINTVRQYS